MIQDVFPAGIGELVAWLVAELELGCRQQTTYFVVDRPSAYASAAAYVTLDRISQHKEDGAVYIQGFGRYHSGQCLEQSHKRPALRFRDPFFTIHVISAGNEASAALLATYFTDSPDLTACVREAIERTRDQVAGALDQRQSQDLARHRAGALAQSQPFAIAQPITGAAKKGAPRLEDLPDWPLKRELALRYQKLRSEGKTITAALNETEIGTAKTAERWLKRVRELELREGEEQAEM